MKPGFVAFFWLIDEPGTTGKWRLTSNKTEFISIGQTVFPEGKRIQAQIFNHIEDIRKFRSSTRHQGLIKAIDEFLLEAMERKLKDWIMFPF